MSNCDHFGDDHLKAGDFGLHPQAVGPAHADHHKKTIPFLQIRPLGSHEVDPLVAYPRHHEINVVTLLFVLPVIPLETLKNCRKPLPALLTIEPIGAAILDEEKGSIGEYLPEVSTDVCGYGGREGLFGPVGDHHLSSGLCPGPLITLAIVFGVGDVARFIVVAQSSKLEVASELPVVVIFLLDVSSGLDIIDTLSLSIAATGNYQVDGIVPEEENKQSQANFPVTDREMQDDHIDDTEHKKNCGNEGTPLDLRLFDPSPIHPLFCGYIVGEVVAGVADRLLGRGSCKRRPLIVGDIVILYEGFLHNKSCCKSNLNIDKNLQESHQIHTSINYLPLNQNMPKDQIFYCFRSCHDLCTFYSVIQNSDRASSMQKFKQQHSRSRFDKYIINAPRSAHHERSAQRHPSSFKGPIAGKEHPASHQNQVDISTLNQLNSKLSIRSSRERAGSAKVSRREAVNRQMTKTTIRRMRRYNTEQKDPREGDRMTSLKKRVNALNAACNQIKKIDQLPANTRTEGYARQAKKRFLMGQLCFTEIDEERIDQQKQYLSKFRHLSRGTKMVQTGLKVEKAGEAILLSCLRAIDRIFVVIGQMQFAGFPAKSNKFVIDFCTEGRMWLSHVFLTESDEKKDVFSMKVKYYVTVSAEKAKEKFSEFLAGRGKNEPLSGYLHDIEALYEHIESSLTQKKLSKLITLTGDLAAHTRSLLPRPLMMREMRLTEDLEEVQSFFGPMREISKISRRKFDELNRTYQRLQGAA